MTTNKRKKNTRYRGSKTHGGGSMKKRRGAGSRGGRGMAGSGKRADHHKQRIIKEYGLLNYFGKKGFTSHKPKIKISPINISYLEDKFNILQKKELIKQENNFYIIDLSKLKINKLLGKGNPTRKYKITTKFISKSAKEKIEKAGGEIVST